MLPKVPFSKKKYDIMKKVNAIIERSSTGRYSIYMEDDTLPYLITGEGATLEEAKADFAQGYEDMKLHFAEEGKVFEEVEFSYCYDMASFLQHYAYAFTLTGLSRITGINQGQLSHYINGTSRPSRRTVEKIETAVHSFAASLYDVRFA